MSRWMNWPFALANGLLLFLAPVFCAAFLGCTESSNSKTSANQFRPVEDGSKSSGEKPAVKETAEDTKLATKTEPAEANATPPSEASEASENGKKEIVGPYAVKLNELRKMSSFRPRGATQEQKLESFLNNARSQIALAKTLANDPAAPDEVRHEALFTSMKGYSMLMEAEDPEAKANFAAVAKQLSEEKNPEIAAVGKAQLFSLKMMDIFALKPQDGKPILEAIERLLEEVGQQKVGFDASVRVAQVLEQMELSDDSAKAMEIISNHYLKSPDMQVALQAHGLQLSLLLKQLPTSEGDALQELSTKLVAKLKELVKLSPNEEDIYTLINRVAHIIEDKRGIPAAMQFYDLAKASYAESKNPKIAEEAVNSVEKAKKRAGLSGSEFDVSGVAVQGAKFDWFNYKGKVVLVDFWATWCGPCLEEMSNIRKYYEMYHDQGFEVVGVNLDDMPENLEAFLAKQTLPWPVVVSSNEKELGMENPNALRCGVEVIPFVVLVDRDGKVLKINVTGDRLGEELAKLFKAPATDKPAEKTEEKPAEKSVDKPAEKTEAPAEKTEPKTEEEKK